METLDEATTTVRDKATETLDAVRVAARETADLVQGMAESTGQTVAHKAKRVTSTWKDVHDMFRAKDRNDTTTESVDQAKKETIMKEEIDAAIEQVHVAHEQARQSVQRFLSRVKHAVLDEPLLFASRK